jgi:CubicO group peptidase (beta-lactamase class C family)
MMFLSTRKPPSASASITKQFTASAILKLQEEGKLSVNDKLSKYIPDFPRGNEVTLRAIADHTSGIHDYSPAEPDLLSHVTKPTTTEADIEVIKNQKHPYDFDPGTKWSYDNSGYCCSVTLWRRCRGKVTGIFCARIFSSRWA